ncbi:hypothetical protein [Wolbachia pipientis]|nr:hypothetical protein [Wolbachia pipientis]
MSSTGMTGEGGYFHDAILFSGSQTRMTRKEHWDDEKGALE